MIIFIIAIVLSIIELVFLRAQALYNAGIFGVIWLIFIFLMTLMSILLITKTIKIENFFLFWKKRKRWKNA